MSTLNIGPNMPMFDLFASNTNLVASGNHFMFVGGSFDTVVATGGMEIIDAPLGNNTITTGSGNDYLFLSGGNNVVDARSGNNTIYDMANPGDTIVMPGASHGFDSVIVTPGAEPFLDFKTALAGTNWNNEPATLPSYIHVNSNAGGTSISLSATANGAATEIASLTNSVGPQWDLSTVLAHAVT